MASILSSLLSLFSGGGASSEKAEPAGAEPQVHAGCTIYATPQREGGQFRLAGRIEKQIDGDVLVRNFIRADIFSSSDDAVECTFRKAQQIIDQHGTSLFSDGEKTRQV
ncbi:HlyU family transcriptional regulator [Rhizobium sp. BK251]|uniref:HlyU family transcriptional regulator n=1 Tax=Rhizobium sp. BK251 TaxID=2512125 RepID=UPI0010504757|nr:HlyU family transcriptional regulator [Rhizobium sp. BK251]TCL67212.1 hypothetical protein EV286_110114 [Rhizobium sp. BK251]